MTPVDVTVTGDGTWQGAKSNGKEKICVVYNKEPDVFLFKDTVSNTTTGKFYLDPSLGITKRLLHAVKLVRKAFQSKNRQRSIIITGVVKSGKTFTMEEFLIALLHTYGMPGPAEDTTVLPAGYAKDTPDWCTLHVNCGGFQRKQGLQGFVDNLITTLQYRARDLGFTDAGHLKLTGTAIVDIEAFMQLLPQDRIHFIQVDEVQNMFLLEQRLGPQHKGRAPLDLDETMCAKRFIKALIKHSPPHVVWVFTGSAMGMLMHLADAPKTVRINMSCTVTTDQMAKTHSLLSQVYTDMPNFEAGQEPMHPALLAFLAEEWSAVPDPKPHAHAWYNEVLVEKIVPELISDLGAVLEHMDAAASEQIHLFLNMLDPSLGVDARQLHRGFWHLFAPYMRPVGDKGWMCVDSPLYRLMLTAIIDDNGQLAHSAVELPPLMRDLRATFMRVSDFCEMLSTPAHKNSFRDQKHLRRCLEDMASQLKKDGFEGVHGDAVGAALRNWAGFDMALTAQNASNDAGIFIAIEMSLKKQYKGWELSELLAWYFRLLRHSVTHDVHNRLIFVVRSRPLTDKFEQLMQRALDDDNQRKSAANSSGPTSGPGSAGGSNDSPGYNSGMPKTGDRWAAGNSGQRSLSGSSLLTGSSNVPILGSNILVAGSGLDLVCKIRPVGFPEGKAYSSASACFLPAMANCWPAVWIDSRPGTSGKMEAATWRLGSYGETVGCPLGTSWPAAVQQHCPHAMGCERLGARLP